MARGRVTDIFGGCANTMAGAFRVVDDYLDRYFDEFGCYVSNKVETDSATGVSVPADGDGNCKTEVSVTGGEQTLIENGKTEVSVTGRKHVPSKNDGKHSMKSAGRKTEEDWGRTSDAYVRADGKRLSARTRGKQLHRRGE